MATADPSRWHRLALALPLVVAAVFLLARPTAGQSAPSGSSLPAPVAATPVEVTAESVYRFATIDEMARASDLVVVGEVVAVERGRLVGDPDHGGVISRVVTIEIADLVRDPSGTGATTVLVEEEGWLPDGSPLVVNGVAPTAIGDVGLWFLDEVPTGDAVTYVVINSQGRFLDDGEAVRGGDPTDELVRTSERLTLAELVDAAREAEQG